MSTTVIYNNTTSTPFSKTTKYLKTAGTYATQDIRVTDTGIAADDYVYEDKDGFINLSENQGTHINVHPLSVTANGTYTASANEAYSSVNVAVPSSAFIKSVIDKSITQLNTSDLLGLTNIPSHSFYNCASLTNVNLPNISTIGNYAFYGCSGLETVNIPSWTGTANSNNNNYIFSRAGDITKTIIVLPSLINFGSRMFDRGHFKIIDIGKNAIGTIFADTFYNDSYISSSIKGNVVVETLILRRLDDVSPATTEDAINGLRTVYVPNDLIESYQTATNWSTRYNYGIVTFLPIEGSQYEHYYADGTPIE